MSRINYKTSSTKDIQKAISTLNRSLISTETAIDNLKSFKDEIEVWTEKLSELQEEASRKKIEFDQDIIDHQLKVIRETIQAQNKVIIDKEDLDELERQVNLSRNERQNAISEARVQFEEDFKAKLSNEMKLKGLEYDNEKARFTAQVETKEAEIVALRETITGMRQELESQKKLTGSIANAGKSQA